MGRFLWYFISIFVYCVFIKNLINSLFYLRIRANNVLLTSSFFNIFSGLNTNILKINKAILCCFHITWMCYFRLNPYAWLVDWSANLSLPKSREMLQIHARIGALVIN